MPLIIHHHLIYEEEGTSSASALSKYCLDDHGITPAYLTKSNLSPSTSMQIDYLYFLYLHLTLSSCKQKDGQTADKGTEEAIPECISIKNQKTKNENKTVILHFV